MTAYLRSLANPIRDLWDVAAHHKSVRLTCRTCRHERVLHGAALWTLFEKKGWLDWLRDVPIKLRCAQCGAKRPELTVTEDDPTGEALPLPSHSEWKRAASRRR